jgi:DNA-directed RNA polymerase subunit beta
MGHSRKVYGMRLSTDQDVSSWVKRAAGEAYSAHFDDVDESSPATLDGPKLINLSPKIPRLDRDSSPESFNEVAPDRSAKLRFMPNVGDVAETGFRNLNSVFETLKSPLNFAGLGFNGSLPFPGIVGLTPQNRILPGSQASSKPPLKYREIDDAKAIREAVFENVLKSFSEFEPVSNDRYTLQLSDVDYGDDKEFSIDQQRDAILKDQSLGRRVYGTWTLADSKTQQVVSQKRAVLASVPYITDRGTFIVKGVERSIKNQQRPLPGIYTRRRNNGELESYVNILPEDGRSHRYSLDPEKGVFKIHMGQGSAPLLPLLQILGVEEKDIKQSWGEDIYNLNRASTSIQDEKKIRENFLSERDRLKPIPDQNQILLEKFQKMRLDPYVAKKTLGFEFSGMSATAILSATSKLLAVSRGEGESDDRDALNFQKFLGPEDLISEQIRKSRGQIRQFLWKATREGNVDKIPPKAFQKAVMSTIISSGLGQALEETNPLDIRDKMTAVTRYGEGGISSADAAPMETREVHPTMFGFLDPLRTPETGSGVGINLYTAYGVKKGSDGRLYREMLNVKTGEKELLSPANVSDSVVAFPGALNSTEKRVPAFKMGKMTWVKKDEVDYELPASQDQFNFLTLMVAGKNSVKGQRAVMASRMTVQALPLKEPEAPFVQTALSSGESIEQTLGEKLGAIKSSERLRVISSDADKIVVKNAEGQKKTIPLYNNFPFNRKTMISQTPVVKPGDIVEPGGILARSNYTNHQGASALGLNARTAYMTWGGKNFEDAISVSQSFAKRATSEHIFQNSVDLDGKTFSGKRRFLSLFPSTYDKNILSGFDDNGLIKPGSVVRTGDPLILAVREKDMTHNRVHKPGASAYSDATVTWDHDNEGIVTDVVMRRNGPVVLVKSFSEMKLGDKLSDRHGGKGVVGDIIPDEKMPIGPDGRPYEVLINPAGTLTRTNPMQTLELALGKIVEKTGQPYALKPGQGLSFVEEELAKHGLKDLETVVDPSGNRKIKDVATGSRFFMKLHHLSEDKVQARSSGGYTAEGTPAKVGDDKAKRLGLLETNALLAHGALATLEDAMVIRSGRNENFWADYMRGYNPSIQKVPFVYEKFINQLKASGINVIPDGRQSHIMAMTNSAVEELTQDREIKSSKGVKWEEGLKEISGGLFDRQATGGHGGNAWSFIRLADPMPNPVMEKPILKLLGLTQAKFESVLAHQENVGEFGSGPQAIKKALESIDLESEIAKARDKITRSRGQGRDDAIKRLGYLKAMKSNNINPAEFMMERAPVLPPAYRPVSMMSNDIPLVDDANQLYAELFDANSTYRELKEQLGGPGAGDAAVTVYKAFKAVTGLGDPVQQATHEKGVKGILKHVFGKNPKYGTIQRKLLSVTVDNVGRGSIVPNPSLDMDSIGLPEDEAFKAYERFVTRRLVRQGLPMLQARHHITNKTDLAKSALLAEMAERPVYASRAPVLHRYGIMAFEPKLVKGSAIQVSPLVIKPFNADFDGDQMNFHIPTTVDAIKEARERMLPSRNLIRPADFKSVNYNMANEYIGGLYHASTAKSKRPVRVFKDLTSAMKSYRDGEINFDDPIEILKP